MIIQKYIETCGSSPIALRIFAVVPIKRLARAKIRLAGLLGWRRGEFAFALASQVISVLCSSKDLAGVVVVTPDARVAARAHAIGAFVVDDGNASLNQACRIGASEAVRRGAEACVIFPSDLARIDTISVADVIQQYRILRERFGVRAVGVLRCKDGTGTNALAFDSRHPVVPSFGVNSFAAHQTGARGWAGELTSLALAFDIDTPEDVMSLVDANVAEHQGAREESLFLTIAKAALRDRDDQKQWSTAQRLSLCAAGLSGLTARARALRDQGYPQLVTYSRKVFLPLTHLCRDSCHYCTFAKAPRRVREPYMDAATALEVASNGARLGCKEALLTLGDRPEFRYRVAREWLDMRGFKSTIDYVAHIARLIRDKTGLLPHINAGCMSGEELAALRPATASMGLMLESASARLCEKGGPHYGSPDKIPERRLATLAEAGRQKIPFTTGILIGIGETRDERIEALLAIANLHREFGHIQEIIIQNFVPKANTRMASVAAQPAAELIWTIAVARIICGPYMSIQVPPNLAPTSLPLLIDAGINDWGGVSPLTPDYVNPESPWPEIEHLTAETAKAGKELAERLTIYPFYSASASEWVDAAMRKPVLELSDSNGLGREDGWKTGRTVELPSNFLIVGRSRPTPSIVWVVNQLLDYGGSGIETEQLASLFDARGVNFHYVCDAADSVRAAVNGDVLTFVVNRNINYTNICGYRCTFCAFSKGLRKHAGAERPYLLNADEIAARSIEATDLGATEVCLQGGIHPDFTGETYLDILRAVKRAKPHLHVHAFSPLEVWHGAMTLGMHLSDYLKLLKLEGLGSLPGTAAEILVDSVRRIICPDKLTTDQWLEVIETAHEVGLRTTATIMFGHVDRYAHWAQHLLKLRDLQKRTKGFTEFVPLPFVAHEAPMYKRGQARPGPTLRESVLMHAVARLALHPHFLNIQSSWVKMGRAGMVVALRAGANDLGGTLMNESITRAAGATHGQQMTPSDMRGLAVSLGRSCAQRTTLYRHVDTPPAEVSLPGFSFVDAPAASRYRTQQTSATALRGT